MIPYGLTKPRGKEAYYHVDDETDCWIWNLMGGPKGHGRVSYLGKLRTAYHVYWEHANGRSVRKGYLLHHKCHNPRCVNPDHLEEMTMKEHKRHHPDPRRKLDNISADWVHMWIDLGYSSAEIGRAFNISRGVINDIRRGVSYQ